MGLGLGFGGEGVKMRGRLGLFMNPTSSVGSTTIIGRTTKLVTLSSAFSSSAGGGSEGGGGDGGGGGRGRGRGASGAPVFNFVSGNADSEDMVPPPAGHGRGHGHGHGHGHGRGNPLPSSPFLPSYNAFVASNPPQQQSGLSRGRGGGAVQQPSEPGIEPESHPKRPIFLKKDEATGATLEADSVVSEPRQLIGEKSLPENILNVLSGSGRGVPQRKPDSEHRIKEENRHLRPKPVGAPPSGAGRGGDRFDKVKGPGASSSASASVRPKISREEAVKKAVGILSRDDGREDGRAERGGGRRRRGGRPKDDSDDDAEDEDDDENALFMGDDADGERLAKDLGPSVMAELTEAFEEMTTDVLPDPVEDEYLEALDTNLKIETEPEYLMGDFETNPDIKEKPPMSLREALEKMKPFLMAYEGIESQEEWEEAMKETMERVPLLKEIVDHYCGPDRVTAKQQHEELERVANTLPASVPNSVKNFTDRAVLSLQSNPGWGFHRKCQFMDKLVLEFSKSCK